MDVGEVECGTRLKKDEDVPKIEIQRFLTNRVNNFPSLELMESLVLGLQIRRW